LGQKELRRGVSPGTVRELARGANLRHGAAHLSMQQLPSRPSGTNVARAQKLAAHRPTRVVQVVAASAESQGCACNGYLRDLRPGGDQSIQRASDQHVHGERRREGCEGSLRSLTSCACGGDCSAQRLTARKPVGNEFHKGRTRPAGAALGCHASHTPRVNLHAFCYLKQKPIPWTGALVLSIQPLPGLLTGRCKSLRCPGFCHNKPFWPGSAWIDRTSARGSGC
jgi:hypothetical protein